MRDIITNLLKKRCKNRSNNSRVKITKTSSRKKKAKKMISNLKKIRERINRNRKKIKNNLNPKKPVRKIKKGVIRLPIRPKKVNRKISLWTNKSSYKRRVKDKCQRKKPNV